MRSARPFDGRTRQALMPAGHGSLFFEGLASKGTHKFIAGVDEAGRGSLAGPVVAAAVILQEGFEAQGIRDSKLMTARGRKKAFERIVEGALSVSLGVVGPDEIERTNILRASLMAMEMAVMGLDPTPDFILVDGNMRLSLHMPQEAIIKGDQRSLTIACASIVAKVYRDRLMMAYSRDYPGYGFDLHKGYGTERHFKALMELGPCPIHRMGFKGVCNGSQEGSRQERGGPRTPIFGAQGI